MIRVAISGAGGKLAGPIIEAVSAADDLQIAALYNPKRAGTTLGAVGITGDRSAVEADVIVETAHPDVVFENLEGWRQVDAAVVVGTSGFTPERLAGLRDIWGDELPCLVVPNFSIGAVLMMRFAAEAAAHFDAIEIVERHHSSKPDAPSGTALATAMGVAGAGGSSVDNSDEMVAGSRGGLVDGVRVHSLRLPGLISHQEVAMSNPGEIFSLEHMSTSYQSFAAGALVAIRGVGALAGGVHVGLGAVL